MLDEYHGWAVTHGGKILVYRPAATPTPTVTPTATATLTPTPTATPRRRRPPPHGDADGNTSDLVPVFPVAPK
ncbi:MAG: hypothetical protein HZY76_03830 [Anaerolineae bacterium]|nr:MAG: hypothetical protein HZY76_03830 [Anaerolineae bacterium]